MNSEQLLELTKVMQLNILDILQSNNLANDRAAQRAIRTIDQMFVRLDIAVEDVIPAESLKAYFAGVDEATKALSAAGVAPVGGISASITTSGAVAAAYNTHVHMNAIVEITDETMKDFKAAIRAARLNTKRSINKALKDVKSDLQSGIISGNPRRVITQRVAESFTKEGMTSFITVDGKKLPLDFYSEVVTRTNLKRANVDGALSRYKENGIKLVIISGGTPTCHQCNQYRDVVFSLIDDDSGFPYLPPKTFPIHPNCNCSPRPYVIEYKTESEINEAKNKASNFDPNKDTRTASQKREYEKKQALNRKRNAEKKQYANYKAVLGEDAPKTLGGFRRSKASNSDSFIRMQQDYRDAMRTGKG